MNKDMDKRIIFKLLKFFYQKAKSQKFDEEKLQNLNNIFIEKLNNLDNPSNLQAQISEIITQEEMDKYIYQAIDVGMSLKYISIFTPLKYDYLKYAVEKEHYISQDVINLIKMNGYDDKLAGIFKEKGIDVKDLLCLSKDEYNSLLDKMYVKYASGAVFSVDFIKKKIEKGEIDYLEYLSNKDDIRNNNIRVKATQEEITEIIKLAIDSGSLTKEKFDSFVLVGMINSLNYSSLIYATKKYNYDIHRFREFIDKISDEPTKEEVKEIINLGFFDVLECKYLFSKNIVIYVMENENVNSSFIEKNLLGNKISNEDKKDILKLAIKKKKISFEFIENNLKNNLLNEEEYDVAYKLVISSGYNVDLQNSDYKYIKYSIENGNFSSFKYILPQSFYKKKMQELKVANMFHSYDGVEEINSLINDINNKKIKVIPDNEYEELVYGAIDNGFDLSSIISSFRVGYSGTMLKYSKYLKYLIDKTDNIQAVFDNKKIDYSSLCTNDVFIYAIEKGYVIHPLTCDKFLTPKFVKLGLFKNQVNNFFYLPRHCLTEDVIKFNTKIHGYDCVKKAIDDGYKISSNSPKIFHTLEYVEYAIEHGQPDAIEYCKTNIFLRKKFDNLVKKAIDKGYTFDELTEKDKVEVSELCSTIEIAIDKGNGCSINKLDGIKLKKIKEDKLDELIKKAILNNYMYTSSTPEFMCKFEYYLFAVQQNPSVEGKNALFCDMGFELTGLSNEQLDEVIMASIELGVKINYIPKSLINNKYIIYAISRGQGDSILLMNFSELSEAEKEKYIYSAIDNGYVFSEKTPKKMLENKYIMYAIEKGNISFEYPKFQYIINNIDVSQLTAEQISSISTFVKLQNNKQLVNFVFSIDDIYRDFDEFGITNTIVDGFFDSEQYKEYDKDIFKRYYNDYFNVTSLNKLLNLLDDNYQYLIKFVKNTLNLDIPMKEEDNEIINEKYCLDIIGYDNFVKIIKFIYYSDNEASNEISNIIKSNKLLELIKIYSILFNEFNVSDFKKIVLNYSSNKELLDNIYLVNDLNEDEKAKIYMLMINGDKSAAGIINKREDLKNYNEIIYNKNQSKIDTDDVKALIFKILFNIDAKQLDIIIKKYDNGSCMDDLYNQLEDEELKNIVKEYACILKFIISINKSDDMESLKIIANKINEKYKDNLDELLKIWEYFAKFDSNLMYILGEEINEKITDFDELLTTNSEDIPMIENEPSYKVSTLKLKDNFEYDNYTIDSDTEVKMIELNGLPFVTFGHVLNAYETTYHGQLLDYNHPRVIGRTHLCLSAIDDNFHGLARNKPDAKKKGPDIDYVQLLFSEVPSENLSIASKADASSYTYDNDIEIYASQTYGQYNPIRETICETFHEEYETHDGTLKYGHNEYTYFRNDIMPSAVLIKGDEPTESEIQAAAYLSKIRGKDIPLVKINKEKYPINSTKEMRKKDEELQKTFYKEMYERKKQKAAKRINLEELRKLKSTITMYFNDTDENTETRKIAM